MHNIERLFPVSAEGFYRGEIVSVMRQIMDSALIWISLTALSSGIGAVAFVLYYARANEFDCMAFTIAVVFGGYSLELGMANGYLPENGLFNAIVGGCVVVAVIVRRSERNALLNTGHESAVSHSTPHGAEMVDTGNRHSSQRVLRRVHAGLRL